MCPAADSAPLPPVATRESRSARSPSRAGSPRVRPSRGSSSTGCERRRSDPRCEHAVVACQQPRPARSSDDVGPRGSGRARGYATRRGPGQVPLERRTQCVRAPEHEYRVVRPPAFRHESTRCLRTAPEAEAAERCTSTRAAAPTATSSGALRHERRGSDREKRTDLDQVPLRVETDAGQPEHGSGEPRAERERRNEPPCGRQARKPHGAGAWRQRARRARTPRRAQTG